jgi:solute carrier family 25 oxoglutarate transporter 11
MSQPSTQLSFLEKPKPTLMNYLEPFLLGGISGCIATSILSPIDITKVRIQIKNEDLGKTKTKGSVSFFTVAKEIHHTTGLSGFYLGLTPALARQVLYTTTRLGLYRTLFDNFKDADGGVSTPKKISFALTAGFLGSVLGNPADVALVRMQADPALPVNQRRNYRNVFDAWGKIVKNEGAITLWRGCEPTVARSMILNMFMLAPYDEIKERLNKFTGTSETTKTRLIAASAAGLMASFCSLPFDNVKTKLQKMKPGLHGELPYKGIGDCMRKCAVKEGIAGLWVGFLPYYMRTAPHIMITLLLQDFVLGWLRERREG